MEVVASRCAGLDVHKESVVACRLIRGPHGQQVRSVRTFGTMHADLAALADWLAEAGVEQVAMESTGVYWRPVHNLLRERFTVLVVNARHLKAVPGRKTDVRDAEWIADLLQHGLLRGSFIPDPAQQALRLLTRQRTTLVQERARVVNRVQKVLEETNLKLASVVSDVTGVSGLAMLRALVAGETDPVLLADLAKGRLRRKRRALERALVGTVQPQQRLVLAQHLRHLDFLDAEVATLNAAIAERMQPHAAVLARLDAIPGVNQRIAEVIIAEVGADLSRFPSARHLASWAGLCPGNDESAGKRRSGKTRKGNKWLRAALTEAAQGAAKKHGSYLQAQARRLAARRGKKRALVAVAHSILVIAYHLITRQDEYRDLGGAYFDERDRHRVERRLVRRLERLGHRVTLEPIAAPA
jgi:transposase